MSTDFSAYRDFLHRSLDQWPEFSWLNRLLQTSKPSDGDETSAQVFELVNNRFETSGSCGTAPSFLQALDVVTPGSQMRVVVLCHGESWDVDRDIVDIVCDRYKVDPRFVAKHFDYRAIRWEKNYPQDLRWSIENANRDTYESKYAWGFGGDLISALSTQPSSWFCFAYWHECLSLAIHEEEGKIIVLYLLRAPHSQLLGRSQIFLCHPKAQVMGSELLTTQRSKSLSEGLTRTLSMLEIPESWNKKSVVLEASLPYIFNLANCCYAKYHRILVPRALPNLDVERTWHDTLFDELREVVSLKRQLEAFLDWHEGSPEHGWQLGRGKPALRLLGELKQDLNDLLSLHHAKAKKHDSYYLGDLIQVQTDEAKETKKTSEKLGYLSQLAYIFLPLQLTTSAMGMNLENFGTGNIQLRTFSLMLAAIAVLSLILRFFPIMSRIFTHRLNHITMMTRYSRRAAYLFGWFCLFHRYNTNEQVWNSGISMDIESFQESWPRRPIWVRVLSAGSPQRTRIGDDLRKRPFVFFPGYWQRVLDELWDIIDTPQWGRKDENLHTA